jgi:hypothetical protein
MMRQFFCNFRQAAARMEEPKFRKLNIDLPLEPITDDRPWALVGVLMALGFLALAIYAFLKYKEIL